MDYEHAITLCGGYGRYQMKLFLLLLPVALTFVFAVSTMPYVLPVITCQFRMASSQLGVLNSAVYYGMIPGGLVWGAISDSIGRRKSLLYACGITWIFEFATGFAINYWNLIVCKFFAGCATAGVHLTYYVYLNEFTDSKNKDSITMLSGATAAAGYFLHPLLAEFLIPQRISWIIIEEWIFFQPWKIFLIVSSLPPLLGFLVILISLEETPKFLLLTNRKEESLRVLKKVYVQNSGNPPDTFPITDIFLREEKEGIEETENLQESSISKGIRNIKPLFKYPYLIPALLTFLAQFITMGAFNAIRPYIPTLFSLGLGYGQKKKNVTSPDTTPQTPPELIPFCELFKTQNIFKSTPDCDNFLKDDVNPKIYIGAVIVGVCVFISFFCFKKIVNLLGKVMSFCLAHVTSAICMIVFPFSASILSMVIVSIFSVCMQNSLTIAIGLMISRVPTTMRGVVVSVVMVSGRIGVVAGNQVLPWITNLSCEGAFWTIAAINLFALPVMWVFSKQPNPLEESIEQAAGSSTQPPPESSKS